MDGGHCDDHFGTKVFSLGYPEGAEAIQVVLLVVFAAVGGVVAGTGPSPWRPDGRQCTDHFATIIFSLGRREGRKDLKSKRPPTLSHFVLRRR